MLSLSSLFHHPSDTASSGSTGLFQVTCTRGLTHLGMTAALSPETQANATSRDLRTQTHHKLVKVNFFGKEDRKTNL